MCHTFLSPWDLEICGFTSELLDEEFVGVASAKRNRVEYSEDGDYRLLEPPKLKIKRKFEGGAASDPMSGDAGGGTRKKATYECIDLS